LVILLAELAYIMPMCTFYSFIGTSLGLDNIINAGYLGFGLHLLIGSLIGIVLGGDGIRSRKVRLLVSYEFVSRYGSWYNSMVIAISANNSPVDTTVNTPYSCNFNARLAKNYIRRLVESFNNRHRPYALEFHLVWGAIFGYIMSSLLRIRIYKINSITKIL
jgi:hypothetical protein